MSRKRKDGGEADTRQEQIDQRRRWLTTAAGASIPAFFILRHRTAHAGEGTSGSPGSSNGASKGNFGQTPSFWKSQVDRWPSDFDPGAPKVNRLAKREGRSADGTRFFSVFQWGEHFRTSEPGRLTLMDVLHLRTGEDPQRLGAYFVAALLNAASGLTEPLPVGRVQEMWQQLAAHGYYSPSPGADRWYANDIKRYIETTWV